MLFSQEKKSLTKKYFFGTNKRHYFSQKNKIFINNSLVSATSPLGWAGEEINTNTMYYYNYYWGMNFIWWVLWIILLFWIFAIPYDIPGQRRRKDSAFDILQKRYADGKITESEYLDKKVILEKEFRKS